MWKSILPASRLLRGAASPAQCLRLQHTFGPRVALAPRTTLLQFSGPSWQWPRRVVQRDLHTTSLMYRQRPKEHPSARKTTMDLSASRQQPLPASTSLYQQFQAKMKYYGPVAFIWGTTVSASTLACCYMVVHLGLLGPTVVTDTAVFFGLDKFIDIESLDPAMGSLALAIVLNELLNPLRWGFIFMTLPAISRWFYGLRLVQNSRWARKL